MKGRNMPEMNARDEKLVQYLNEAYGKERQLETALEAHIAMTTRAPYRKRLQEHLRETKNHARQVESRIRKLGGSAETLSVPGPEVVAEAASKVQEAAQRGIALAQGPLHAVRGTGEEEKQLKNAKTEYSNEAEEIAGYTAIQTLAETVGDRETARIARAIRREEERMASFLERLIPQLTKAVAKAEIPAALRNGSARRSSSRTSNGRRASGTSRRASGSRATTSSRRTTSASRGRAAGSRKTSASSRGTTSASARRTTGGSTRRASGSSSRRASTASSSRKRASGSRSASARSGRASSSRASAGRSSSRPSGARSSGTSRRTSGRSTKR
jgi:ferritin-like metal-binding protein YciE